MAGIFKYSAAADFDLSSSSDLYYRSFASTVSDYLTGVSAQIVELSFGTVVEIGQSVGGSQILGVSHTSTNWNFIASAPSSSTMLLQTDGGFYLDWSGQNTPARLFGGGYGDVLAGGNGADSLSGKGGNDVLTGNAGSDTLNGGAGIDTMTGGIGDDTYYVDNAGDTVVESAAAGTDTVIASASYVMADNVENLTFSGSGAMNGLGNSLANVMTGAGGNNYLKGETGNDTLYGNDGNDRLHGGAGTDVMIGGRGNDVYYVDASGDTVTENDGEGTDTVYASVTHILGADVEHLKMQGTGNINGAGNALNNRITGNSGNNAMDGDLGVDTLTGGAGLDVFVFSTPIGQDLGDRITDFTVGEDTISLLADIFTGIGSLTPLDEAAFAEIGSVTADSRVIYDPGRGILYYDTDGSGDAAAIRFAVLSDAPALSAADFLVL